VFNAAALCLAAKNTDLSKKGLVLNWNIDDKIPVNVLPTLPPNISNAVLVKMLK
jgi:hypothetical protein